MSDIIDTIDELVDWQLSKGPVDDYNADRYEKCWHCGGDWHGIALTRRVVEMYTLGRYNETYSIGDDDSPVVCPGSDFIGPPPGTLPGGAVSPFGLYWHNETFLNSVTLMINGQHIDLPVRDTRFYFDDKLIRPTLNVEISRHPIRKMTCDVLAETAPHLYGTWEPLTAPGVARHPGDTCQE